MLLAQQLANQRFIIPGPLVQRNVSLSLPGKECKANKKWVKHLFLLVATLSPGTPKKDRIRTVSQRTKPNSRTIFIGEQPNPWKLLHLQDMMSRHRGAKRLRR